MMCTNFITVTEQNNLAVKGKQILQRSLQKCTNNTESQEYMDLLAEELQKINRGSKAIVTSTGKYFYDLKQRTSKDSYTAIMLHFYRLLPNILKREIGYYSELEINFLKQSKRA